MKGYIGCKAGRRQFETVTVSYPVARIPAVSSHLKPDITTITYERPEGRSFKRSEFFAACRAASPPPGFGLLCRAPDRPTLRLAEVFHQHDVGIYQLGFSVKDRFAVGCQG
ncbi:MAG: hypothetical protein QOI53_2970 [Verrucomicrobiota bacterium]|nr:hypothetical protein [Verrucomicrobiota bacterium]